MTMTAMLSFGEREKEKDVERERERWWVAVMSIFQEPLDPRVMFEGVPPAFRKCYSIASLARSGASVGSTR